MDCAPQSVNRDWGEMRRTRLQAQADQVTDALSLGGSTSEYMYFNPKPSFNGLQVALMQ